jgi:hypothetical protein
VDVKSNPRDEMSANDAQFAAQKIALAPIIFQAARLLREFGILKALRHARAGLTLEEISDKVETSSYGVLVLLEAGLAAELVCSDGQRYSLTRAGAYILSDEMTRINMDVVHHCCFQPLYYLEGAIREGKPVGLHKIFVERETLYPALPNLPERARSSWFQWDHYYSDAAFLQALPIVFERDHRKILDVGGNTGKWAFKCAEYAKDVSVTILDLPALKTERVIDNLGICSSLLICRTS